MFTQNIVSDITNPQLEAYCIVLLGEWPGKYVGRAPLIMRFHDQLDNKWFAGVVVRNGDVDFSPVP